MCREVNMNEIHKRAVGQSHAGASSLDNRPQGTSDAGAEGRSQSPLQNERPKQSGEGRATRGSRILLVMLVVTALLTSVAMVSLVAGRVMYDADARNENEWRVPYLVFARAIGENATWLKYKDWVDGHGFSYHSSLRNPTIFALLDGEGMFIHDGMMVPFPNGQYGNPYPITRGEFVLNEDLYVLVLGGDNAPYGQMGTVRINASGGEVVGPLWNIDWPLLIDVETAIAVSGDTVHMAARDVTHGLTSAAESSVYYTRSEDPAAIWSAPIGILSQAVSPYRVNIAVDGADTVAVAVSATDYSSDEPMKRDFLIWSHDGGRSWEEPINVTGDPVPHDFRYRSHLAILPNGTSILCFDPDRADLSPEFFMIGPSGQRVRLTPPHGGEYRDLKLWMEPGGTDVDSEVRALLTDENGTMGYELRLGHAGLCETMFPVSSRMASGIWFGQSDESIRSVAIVDRYTPFGGAVFTHGEIILLETNRSTGEERPIGGPYTIVWGHTADEDMDYQARTSRLIGYTWVLVGILMALVLMVFASRIALPMGQGHRDLKRKARAVGATGILILAMFIVIYLFIDEYDNRQYYSFYIFYLLLGILLVEMLAMTSRRWSVVRLLHLIFIPYLLIAVGLFALSTFEAGHQLKETLDLTTMLGICILMLAMDLVLVAVLFGRRGTPHPLRGSRVVRLLPIVCFYLIALMPIVLMDSYFLMI